MNAEKTLEALFNWVEVTVPNTAKLAVPVSGGSDGALALLICSKALPGRVVGLHCTKPFTSLRESLREKAWFESVATIRSIPLTDIHADAESLRWALVATYCLETNSWPVGTRNRTEQVLGTYSRASSYATILPLVGLLKSEVLQLCRILNVPDAIMASSRRPDPPCGRLPEFSNIGIERIDSFVQWKTGEVVKAVPKQQLSEREFEYLEGVWRHNQWKENAPKMAVFRNFN